MPCVEHSRDRRPWQSTQPSEPIASHPSAGAVQEYFAGETLHGLARHHDLSRTLIRIWIDRYDADAFDEDTEADSTIQEYEALLVAIADVETEANHQS